MADRFSLGDFDYGSRVVDERALLLADDEGPFTRESFDLLAELHQSVNLVASVSYLDDAETPRPMDRDEAIQAGLMMRCAKLQFGLLDPAIASRMELFSVIWRSALEAAVNAIYLVQHGNAELFDSYVRYSLRLDKRLLDRVESDLAQQDDPPLPIQERIVRSIRQVFETAGINPNDVDADDRSDWSGRGGIHGRFEAIGWKELYPLFSIGSHYAHGNWHDLYVHHLGRNRHGYFVMSDFTRVTCQPILVAVKILSNASHIYLTAKVAPSDDREMLELRIEDCVKKAEQIEALHERYLARTRM